MKNNICYKCISIFNFISCKKVFKEINTIYIIIEMKLNNLPLEIRLNIMSYNCYDICPYRYIDIIQHPFPTWEKVKRNPFWKMSLTEYLDGKTPNMKYT